MHGCIPLFAARQRQSAPLSHIASIPILGTVNVLLPGAAARKKPSGTAMGVSMIDTATNVVAFKPRTASLAQSHPKSLLERIYTAGSLALPAGDTATKTAAVMLQALGFVVIEEVLADGTLRRLVRGQARKAMDRPWRLSKPAYSGEVGIPDGQGSFQRPL